MKKPEPTLNSEELARSLNERFCHVVIDGARRRKADYVTGEVAGAYLAARQITIVADDDGFTIQTEVNGDILPWLHDVPDGACVKSITEHGRTQWRVFDRGGTFVGLVFHGIGSMWQWRFHAA